MADNDMSFRQRAVIEFLVKEEITAAEIHQRLQRAYGSVCMGASSVRRWVKYFKDGNTSIQDEPRSLVVSQLDSQSPQRFATCIS
jgi:transposase